MRRIIWFACLLLLVPAVASSRPIAPSLKRFLQTHYGEEAQDIRVTVRSHEDHIYVFAEGDPVCGSGGCHLLVLKRKGQGYRVLGETGLSHRPVRVLTSRHNGQPDITVFVAGGGILPGYEARLRFDGRRYPNNPTVSPAEPLTVAPSGRLVIGEKDVAVPLLP